MFFPEINSAKEGNFISLLSPIENTCASKWSIGTNSFFKEIAKVVAIIFPTKREESRPGRAE
ncbi:hypothetical protein WEN_01520 [Mycoplasma wenyonii str. Massachusetts]|uniref:Uncharacterized protein n=1 Tax=Mycoplasma wenyonii (strain Massachusetts) TaxID=1197325 RepID=I6YLD1_MYCWM|nr:hypothetical protein WEN_01520 [Mycoplasma wenyonii str. Massachusetts]